jgi:hypothetical protein
VTSGGQAADLEVRVRPAVAGRADVLCGHVVQPGPGRQGHDQAGMRHEIRVIERDTGPRDSMRQSHSAKELLRERAVDDSRDVRLAAVRALGGGGGTMTRPPE